MDKIEAFIIFRKRMYTAYYVMLGLLTAAVGVTAVCVRLYPTTHTIRLMVFGTILFGLFAAFVSIVGSMYHKPKLLYPFIFFLSFVIVWWFLGDKEIDANGLRKIYVSRLKAHVGIKYAPNGETINGVDSSGLARSSFWQAMLIEGLRELNPRLIGSNMIKFWFTDLDNSDILNGKNGYTVYVDSPASIDKYDSFLLDEGDIAVTRDHTRLMIYAGNGQWMDSEEQYGKVRLFDPSQCRYQDDPCKKPVIIVRWSLLDKRSSAESMKNTK